jgi:hypothetical protein
VNAEMVGVFSLQCGDMGNDFYLFNLKTAGVEREEAETCTGLCGLNFIGNASLQFGPVDKEF